jgi:hypothetical protein
MGKIDGYSDFSFLNALKPQDLDGTLTNGTTIDTQGFDTVTFVVNVGAITSAGSLSATTHQIKLEHSDDDSTWSEVYPSQMIHSVIGEAGPYSTLDSGIFQSIASVTDANKIYAVGYKGPKRYARIAFSAEGLPSVISAAAIALLGEPGNWPVNEPIGE